ncbi:MULTISPECIES: FAD-dependent monooxygenase [unclassified Rhizobium]|uniref:FAD-dependent monooxygenase n=1 Tax=unclassified Rhizobium TaxID=2613769 RepID=UPI0016103FB6|nr:MULTISPECIES: FAD-dependent monooxygenase [unclassified Rhizobium]MBB3385279.1 2-polyprenyl-6-methoxyphenol hydroxylase-like FAD-dependent oxidoreductase [Rhizobium sp. BK098]MBB3616871.1 2-polyprenyl-6-methoxyphenol hydroxylase-like FAD-dependent oxidoreductase [Rhizobium sp. BK609]MBB3682528.1 2-polyprenyl-6-methoxyphenol hydroxylase-like FAD-dependent oxidoreductase [Rhizobium sp. BK612]
MCPIDDPAATMNRATNSEATIGICGAGIGGLVLALRLARLGFHPVLFEARSKEAALSEGEFLTLASNGMNGLRAVDCYEEVLREGLETRAIELCNARGKRLALVDQSDHLAAFGTPAVTIRRAVLTGILIEKCQAEGITIQFGRRVTKVDNHAHAVTLNFSEGVGLAVDLLVAADGLRSFVRTQIFPDYPQPQFTGLIGTGGIVDAEIPDTNGVMRMTFGEKAFFGYIKTASHPVYWFDSFPADTPEAVRALEPAARAAHVREMHADDPEPNRSILQAVGQVERSYPIFEMPQLPVWSSGRVVLLGDAAHAIGPHAGQGASMAIEDAVVLSSCLAATLDHGAAFACYEALRRPRIARVVKLTRQNASRKRKNSRLSLFLRDLLLPLLIPMTVRASRRLFAYRVDLDPLEANTSFESGRKDAA